MPVIKLIRLASGEPSPLDGQYVVEYDPTREGTAPDGQPMSAHLVTTPDISKATVYPSAADALDVWRQQHGIRHDGLPNRPMTAYTVEIL